MMRERSVIRALSLLGEAATVSVLTKQVIDNEYGVVSESYGTATSMTCVMNPVDVNDSGIAAGTIELDDVIMYCKGSETVSKDDKIVWDSANYTVYSIQPTRVRGSSVVLKIILKRYTTND